MLLMMLSRWRRKPAFGNSNTDRVDSWVFYTLHHNIFRRLIPIFMKETIHINGIIYIYVIINSFGVISIF